MTLKEFLVELEKTPRRGWKIYALDIRRIYKGSYFCPITAVVFKKTKCYIPDYNALSGGCDILRLSIDDCRKIISAADSLSKNNRLRNKILRAVGLKS